MPRPIGPSLDHVMAEQLSPMGAPLFVNVAGSSVSAQSAISFSAAEKAYSGLNSPRQVFAQLTGLFTDGKPLSPDSYQALRGKSVLDLVADDLATLERSDLSRTDRLKLEAWKTLLHETGSVVPTFSRCSTGAADALGLTEENFTAASASAGLSGDPLTVPVGATLDRADFHSNLAVLAAACNANPIIFLKYPGNYVFKGLGLTLESHSLSHRIGNAGLQGTCVADVVEMIAKIDAYHAKKFAYLVSQLDGVQEGEGTLLDHTATVWFQELSDGAAHNHNNLPIVQAGGASGYFKTGWAINVEDGSPTLTSGNSELYCDPAVPAGDTAPSITLLDQASGTDPTIANAPINKYFCNLMNAVGVKAGEDGFPLKGGTAEVTRFGMYDRTEDFIGGGTNPPTIHDPGEFAALRA